MKNDVENEQIFDASKEVLENIESKIGTFKKKCPYSVNAKYIKALQHIHIIGACEPTYYILPSLV